MYFNSFEFAVFFPIVLGLYWVLPHRWQNRMLLVASYVFYGFWDWRFLSLIAISTVVDYFVGLGLQGLHGQSGPGIQGRKKRLLVISVVTNLGILGFFKYFNFFSDSLQGVLGAFGLQTDWVTLNIVLPVGISFYTFQTMSYTIDIYRGLLKPTRRFLDFALYVAFFPQLVAGPIERAKALLPRLLKPRSFDRDQFGEGLHLILLGLFKKVFVADNLGPIVDRIFANPDPTGLEAILGGWAFAYQVYCDFSGYSDIARGCAKCMGIELMVNFRISYAALNPVERWQRNHISLSSWLRDYLYIPLGGSRKGEAKTYRNITLTMLLGGLWHGASWNFVLWGAWEGAMLIVYRLCSPLVGPWPRLGRILPDRARRILKLVLMYNLVSIGLIFFRDPSLSHIGVMISHILTWHGAVDWSIMILPFGYALPLAAYEIFVCMASCDDFQDQRNYPLELRAIAYGIMVYLVAFHGAATQSFIYFQF